MFQKHVDPICIEPDQSFFIFFKTVHYHSSDLKSNSSLLPFNGFFRFAECTIHTACLVHYTKNTKNGFQNLQTLFVLKLLILSMIYFFIRIDKIRFDIKVLCFYHQIQVIKAYLEYSLKHAVLKGSTSQNFLKKNLMDKN